jgi:ATP-dependent DNA ligase
MVKACDTYWAFDVLQLGAEDLQEHNVAERFDQLMVLLGDVASGSALRLIPCATTAAAKRQLFDRLKLERAEGVVFKQRGAKYVAGRPNSGGHHLKFKFTATASCKVLYPNARSVAWPWASTNIREMVLSKSAT